MQQEYIYSNDPLSTLWFKAEANCVKLNDRKTFLKMEMKCELCGDEKEDIIHFILEFSMLQIQSSLDWTCEQILKKKLFIF